MEATQGAFQRQEVHLHLKAELLVVDLRRHVPLLTTRIHQRLQAPPPPLDSIPTVHHLKVLLRFPRGSTTDQAPIHLTIIIFSKAVHPHDLSNRHPEMHLFLPTRGQGLFPPDHRILVTISDPNLSHRIFNLNFPQVNCSVKQSNLF